MNNLPNTERKCRNVDSFLAFLLFVCLLFTAPYVRAQETRSITLNVQNETVENVFNQLGVQTGLKFFYDQEIVNAAPSMFPTLLCKRSWSRLPRKQNYISIGTTIQYP